LKKKCFEIIVILEVLLLLSPELKGVPAVGVDVVDTARDLEVEHGVEGVLAPVLDLGADLQLLAASNNVGFKAENVMIL